MFLGERRGDFCWFSIFSTRSSQALCDTIEKPPWNLTRFTSIDNYQKYFHISFFQLTLSIYLPNKWIKDQKFFNLKIKEIYGDNFLSFQDIYHESSQTINYYQTSSLSCVIFSFRKKYFLSFQTFCFFTRKCFFSPNKIFSH